MGVSTAQKVKEDLVLGAQDFARKVVKRLMRSMQIQASMEEDLISAANMGLVEAAQNYNPSKGTNFKSYAYLRIRGAVIDTVRSNSTLSQHAYSYGKALDAVQDLREMQLEDQARVGHRRISSEEALARVFEMAASGALAFRASLDESQLAITERVSTDGDPEQQLLTKQNFLRIRRIVETLPEKERNIVKDYYFRDKSFIEIVDEHSGISKSWVSRLHSRAIEILKKKLLEELASESCRKV